VLSALAGSRAQVEDCSSEGVGALCGSGNAFALSKQCNVIGGTDCSPIYLSEIEGLQRYLVVEIAANEVKDGRPSAR
jgi:hypothetical protein